MKKYTCIVKINNDKFLKYRVDNLISFTNYLDKNWKEWKYFNVFDKKTKKQIANFTQSKRPTTSEI